MSDAAVLTYDPRPRVPKLVLPTNTCDTHVHVFGPAYQFPYAPTRTWTPVDATREQLFTLHRTLGIERCVVVQSILHGLDNSVVEAAIQAGGGRYVGVALVPLDVVDSELERLSVAGFRGVRFNFIAGHSNPDPQQLIALTHRLAPHGLHLQVHFAPAGFIHQLAEPLAHSAVPVVIDHMARVDATNGPSHPDFAALLRLLHNPLFRVKVSGIDRVEPRPKKAGSYPHAIALARLLVETFPDQCLWGTDWPHPNHTHVPDDASLVEALAEIAPTADLRYRLLVRNPQDLYQFSI